MSSFLFWLMALFGGVRETWRINMNMPVIFCKQQLTYPMSSNTCRAKPTTYSSRAVIPYICMMFLHACSLSPTPSSPSGAMHAVCADGGELRDRSAGGEKAAPLFSGHIAGGTHHAFSDRGEGFCVFSDIAVSCLCVGLFVRCGLNFRFLLFLGCPSLSEAGLNRTESKACLLL